MRGRNNKRRKFGSFNKNNTQKHSNENRRPNPIITEHLSEKEVGIYQYFTDIAGFTAVVKERFSDFHVNEIDLDGNVATLSNTDIPKETKEKVDFNTLEKSPLDSIPQTVWDEIKKMMISDSKELIKLEINDLTKEERKTIHLKMKEIFGTKISVDTVASGDNKFLHFKRPSPNDKQRFSWPADKGDYVHFILYKEGLDTLNACYSVSEAIGIKPSAFSYAGVKDKRAKSSQWFSVKRVEPWKLIMRTKKIRNVKIGNITYKNSGLKLGDLSGNRFKIALKNVVCENDTIKKAIENIEKHGFINYYGLQRFGNDKEVPTYSIGIQLLLGNWKEACELILKPKKSDEPNLDITQAKKNYAESHDPKKAYECLKENKNNCLEAKLLTGLVKEEKNYVNALEAVPRNMRLLYIHSFQSLIWNNMVSKRIEKYGIQPVENDLVLINNVYIEPDELNDLNSENDESETSIEEESKPRPQVRPLTKSDLQNFTIYDIVLPLPGYDVEYPENLRDEYKEELEKHGLTLEMSKQRVKTYNLSGTYRKIVSRIKDLEWRIMRYDDPNQSLILSDFDKLRKFKPTPDITDGKFKAVIIEFSLESASYATMVLREILKIDTSPGAQIKLNNYGAPKTKMVDSSNGGSDENLETIDTISSGSLLSNEEKLEAFKKNIFDECSNKRKIDDVDEKDDNKKIKNENENFDAGNSQTSANNIESNTIS